VLARGGKRLLTGEKRLEDTIYKMELSEKGSSQARDGVGGLNQQKDKFKQKIIGRRPEAACKRAFTS